MKFTRLKVHGFKSFCDETELVMEPGLTGIVGPNGCGKSNLVEAMRWVMGESSYKAMRASGMDDVIFSGSANRPGRNSAEVTLVLDNSDRTAPAALNTADTLEVTRRIEREAGSVYRVNGREVRARDVQLLFADASTGAHSPAMVRQGQVGELIAAKPAQRRALLEEAAGISGLHSRRHEAELRLRAAEQNLARVDDVVGQIETQLETLKRQARLALRYRSLSGDIRQAEATLYHIRWVAARVAEKETEAEQARLIRALADATHAERLASGRHEAAEAQLQPLREAEAASGARLQRLTILLERLEDEARRASQRRAEYGTQLAQLASDAGRERALVAESEEILSGLDAEEARLAAETEAGRAEHAQLRAEAETARTAALAAEAEARAGAEALAQARARHAQALRAREDARTRLARFETQLTEILREAEALTQRLKADDTLARKREALEKAQAATGAAETEALAAEEASLSAEKALAAARPRLQEIEAGLARLEAEAATLSKLIAAGASPWPAVADALAVAPGYETALGAALGEDLEAASDAGAPRHWRESGAWADDPALPEGAEALSRHVSGGALLGRRLDQVGLVPDAETGLALMGALRPGQRLVTRAGDLWRWDGFVSAADAPSPAALRLAQRNRLTELDAEIAHARTARAEAAAALAGLTEAHGAARAAEKARREAWRAAQHAIGAAQSELDAAQRAAGALSVRRGALEEARMRLEANLSEARAGLEAAEAALAETGPEDEARARAEAMQAALAEARRQAEEARTRLGAVETAARLRESRLARLAEEREGWRRRRAGALGQLETLGAREADIRAQLDGLDADPEGFAARRAELEAGIEAAREDHKGARDMLERAQTGLREASQGLRQAGDALSAARVELGRVEERLKGTIAQRLALEKQIGEQLGVPASRTLEIAGIRPEQALPQEGPTEQRLDRLKAERERLGGVNLSAEREAEETREKLDTMVADRDDLIEAIAKLRQGIQALNREGRARLSRAFEAVNAHFKDLFTTLFGGGTAELSFIESEDPLEAGLEIIARPPGKKPTTMTLLSGGEQALTALSLIFAVFLTNPAPICVLDEVDAPLDDANVERFCNLVDTMRQRTDTRFLIVTHNPITMSRVDRLFGVTQAERGVSQLVSVDLRTAESFREAV